MYNNRLTVKLSKAKIGNFLLFVLIVLLVGANSQNPDLHNYIYNYSRRTTVVEGSFAFSFINNLFYNNGISFEVFRLVIYLVGYLILAYANRKLTANHPFVYLAYAISFMMIDSTQTYNFLGMCLFYLGIAYLICDDNKWKYVLCIVLASGFHVVFLFYLPFIFIYSKTDRKQLLKVYLIVLGIVVAISIVAGVSGLATIIQRVLTVTGLDTYQNFIQARTRYGHLYPMMTHLVCCAFGVYYYLKAERECLANQKIYRLSMLLLLYGVFAFPFFRFQLTLGRLTRNLELLTFITGVNYAKEMTNKHRRTNVFLCLLGLSIFLGYFIVYSSYMDTIVEPFFEYNWILRGK